MKRIHILESTLRYLLDEGRNAEKAKQKTIAVMKNYLSQNGIQGEQLEAMAVEYENSLKEWLFHANVPDSIIRLEPIMANVAMQLGFTPKNKNTNELYRLKEIMNYITANYQKEDFPIALNKLTLDNTSFDRLNEIFGSAIDTDGNTWQPSTNDNMKPHYAIQRLDTFEEANEYYPYTQDICYLDDEETWNEYTEYGSNTVYVLLRDGWEDIQAKHGEDTPYDDYGKSMIFLIINLDGKLVYSNTRWNHNTNGKGPRDVDQSFTKKMISNILQVNFDETFKSKYDKEYLRNMFSSLTKKAMMIRSIYKHNYHSFLSRFEAYYALNSSYMVVRLNSFYNIIDNDGNIIFPNEWFNTIDKLTPNAIYVRNIKDKVNVLNNKCVFLNGGKEWFEDAAPFTDDIILVDNENGLVNLLFSDGKLINDGKEWFKHIFLPSDGFIRVMLPNNFMNFVDNNSNYINDGDMWFKSAEDFYDGYAVVQREDGLFNYLRTDGQLINGGKEWFMTVNDFHGDFAQVMNKDGFFNLINRNGEFINDGKEWFQYISPVFFDDFSKVIRKDGLENLIDKNGKFINDGKEWFRKIKRLDDGYSMVKRQDGTDCLIDQNGNLSSLKENKYPISDMIIENFLHSAIKKYLLYN